MAFYNGTKILGMGANITIDDEGYYYKGQLDLIKGSEALKGYAIGTGVSLKDISPVKHDVPIQLSGLPPIEEAGTIIPIPTPYAFEDDAAQTGMTWTVAEDGTITIDVDGTKTDGTSPWFIAENLVLPAGEYVISAMKSVTVTPEIDGGMWAHSIKICDGDMYYGSGNVIKTVELPTDNSTYMPDVSFTLTKETAVWIDYMYGSAGIGMGRVPDRVITVIKPEIKSDITYLPADYSEVKVQRLGKNIFDGQLTLWRGNNTIMSKNVIKVKRNTQYVISTVGTTKTPTFIVYGNNTGVIADLPVQDKNIAWQVTTFNSGEYDYVWFRLYGENSTVGIGLDTPIQIEEGKTATEFEPYIEPTLYSSNTDGTVEGVTSLYPTTTLMTDTNGVIVAAEYIKDIDKAFQAALP